MRYNKETVPFCSNNGSTEQQENEMGTKMCNTYKDKTVKKSEFGEMKTIREKHVD
jgi:hypothetical protein